MKIERLYAITVYLFHHGRTTARDLAAHLKVSVRTVQRDVEVLCQAGIPVLSIPGSAGGYEISEQLRPAENFITAEDYSGIRRALGSLVSVCDDPRARMELEKIADAAEKSSGDIVLDGAVFLEEDCLELLWLLQRAVAGKRVINFTYTAHQRKGSAQCVEPIALVCRCGAWYLLGYSRGKNDYQIYQLARMSDAVVTEEAFIWEHGRAQEILKKMM